MQAPKYDPPPPPAVDPNTATLAAQAQSDHLTALQGTAQIDTASLMARYGTRLAMAGSTTSPLAVTPPLAKVA